MKGYVEFFVLLLIVVIFYSSPTIFSQFYSNMGGKLILLSLIVYFALESSVAGILGVILYVVLANKQVENMENMDDNKEKDSDKDSDSDSDKDNNKDTDDETDQVSNFRKSYCENNKMKLSGNELQEKMKSVKFLGDKCNVCDDDCKFEITTTAEQLSLDEMMRPKDSNTMNVPVNNKSSNEVDGVSTKPNLKEGFISN